MYVVMKMWQVCWRGKPA